MKPRLTLLVLLVIALIGSFGVYGLLTSSRNITSSGTVKAINVEVYWDQGCTQIVDNVDWGFAEPGDASSKTIYIKNSGNAPLILGLSYSDWVPTEAGDSITLAWDQEGTTINAGDVQQAVLTLSISDDIIGVTDFSFNIVIEGSG